MMFTTQVVDYAGNPNITHREVIHGTALGLEEHKPASHVPPRSTQHDPCTRNLETPDIHPVDMHLAEHRMSMSTIFTKQLMDYVAPHPKLPLNPKP